MRPLIVIPARGGSKGVPGKNIKELNGKPLIQYTIDTARKVLPDNQIIVTTDSIDIKNFVEDLGLKVPFLRPQELATDTAGTYEVLLHALAFYENQGNHCDIIILLQPTSPFRTSIQVLEAMSLLLGDLEMIVSVKESKSNPYYNLRVEDSNGLLVKPIESSASRRQDVPKVWELNGAIYIINVNALKTKKLVEMTKVKKYVMNDITSHDIDSMHDWVLAEYFVESNLL